MRPVKTEWWGTGVVICLERGANLHMAQLMPLPLTVSCFSKIQTGFIFLVSAYPGSPGKGPLSGRVCVYVFIHEDVIIHYYGHDLATCCLVIIISPLPRQLHCMLY